MPDTELVNSNGQVVDLAKDGPPEGERGTLNPSGLMLTESVWGAYDHWERGQGSPDERKLKAMLDRDGKAQALEAVLSLPLRWAPTEIEPHKGDSGEAEFVTEALTTPPWDGGMSTPLEQVIAHMTSAGVFRRAFFEKCWRVIEWNGRLVWVYDKLAPRPAESCRLQRDERTGNFRGFKQRVSHDHPNADKDGYVRFGPEKAFVYVHDWVRHPLTGRSALETAYRAYEAKQKVRYLWFAFLERHATPWTVAKDEGGDPSGGEAFARKAASLKGGGVISATKDQSLDLHEPGSDGAAFKDCMDWLSAEMAESVLAGFTGLSSSAASGHGSYALSKNDTDFFLRSRYADLREMATSLTWFAVSDLIRWNFPNGKTPTFKFGRLTDEQAELIKELWLALATNAAPNPRIPGQFLDLLSERLAALLDLDAEKVRELFEQGGQTTPASVEAGASAVVQLLREAGVEPAAAPVAA